jgi:hypothetical protein
MTGSCGAQPSPMQPHSTDPDPDSVAIMAEIESLPRAWRDLVREFGWVIVRDMRADGHRNAAKLREELDAWRERQQEHWLAEIPYRRMVC